MLFGESLWTAMIVQYHVGCVPKPNLTDRRCRGQLRILTYIQEDGGRQGQRGKPRQRGAKRYKQMEKNWRSKGQTPSIQHGRPLLSRMRTDACHLALFVCSIGGARQLSQLVRDWNTITQMSFEQAIRHVESTRWGMYPGVATGMGRSTKNGRWRCRNFERKASHSKHFKALMIRLIMA